MESPRTSFDAVVSLSALEHIPLEQLGNALNEIRRVLKDPILLGHHNLSDGSEHDVVSSAVEGILLFIIRFENTF